MIVVNGTPSEFTSPTVRDVLAGLGLPDQGVAVAVDGVVVPKGQWHQVIPDDAQVEVVTAVQGG